MRKSCGMSHFNSRVSRAAADSAEWLVMSGKKGVFCAHHSSLSISCYPNAPHNPSCQPLPLILYLASLDIEPGFEFTQLMCLPNWYFVIPAELFRGSLITRQTFWRLAAYTLWDSRTKHSWPPGQHCLSCLAWSRLNHDRKLRHKQTAVGL